MLETFDGLISNPAALETWLDDALGAKVPLVIERVPAGASNILFRIDRGERRYALRRPPKVSNDPTSNNLKREIRLLEALARTDVPHARMIASCLDEAIIGAPFVILDWVDGFTPRSPFPEAFVGHERALGAVVVESLAAVARVDWKAIGLEGFGKPDGFLERQVERWSAQLERYRVRDIPHLDDVGKWLKTNAPPSQVGLMHGDYSFANVMIGNGLPVRMAAIVDWEMSTIGDPLVDLGHLLSSWQDATSGETWGSFVDWKGFASRAEMAALYAEKSGRSIEHLRFYLALATFRLGIIMEGAYARFVKGDSKNPAHARMEHAVPLMLRQSARVIEGN